MREIERAINNVTIWHALDCYPLAKVSKLKISKNCISHHKPSRDELPLASIRHRNNPGVGRNLPADKQFMHGSLETSAIAFSGYSPFHGN